MALRYEETVFYLGQFIGVCGNLLHSMLQKGHRWRLFDVRNDAEVEPEFISWVGSPRIRFKCREVGTATYKSDKCDILPR